MNYLFDIQQAKKTLFVLCVYLLAGCGSSLSYQEALEKNRKEFETREQRDDAEFLVDAQSLNLLLMDLNEMALERAYSAELVEMVRANQKDHEKLADELDKLESREDIRLPSEMSREHHRWLEDAEEASREEFDQNLVRILQRVNRENVYRYEEQATRANDEDVRAFAARRLGLFETHEERLEKIEDRLLTTY